MLSIHEGLWYLIPHMNISLCIINILYIRKLRLWLLRDLFKTLSTRKVTRKIYVPLENPLLWKLFLTPEKKWVAKYYTKCLNPITYKIFRDGYDQVAFLLEFIEEIRLELIFWVWWREQADIDLHRTHPGEGIRDSCGHKIHLACRNLIAGSNFYFEKMVQ